MTEGNYTKKQHYIPRFLLENFTDKEGYIYCLDKTEKKIFKSKPESIGYEKHLYSIESEKTKTKDDRLEKNLPKKKAKLLRY